MTHLDRNAITEVERLTIAANGVIERNVQPGQKLLVRDPEGKLGVFQVPLNNTSSTLLDLNSLKTTADIEQERGNLKAAYVGDQGITLTSDDGEHRWKARLELPYHPLYQFVQAWGKPTTFTQKELVRMLRTQLRDHVDPTITATFMRLKFTNNSETTAQVRPTSAALDVSIRQQVAQDNGQDAPETIRLRGPVYDIPEARSDEYEFTVYVEYDHDAGKFILQTVHADLRQAQEEAISGLIGTLKDHSNSRYPVLYGSITG